MEYSEIAKQLLTLGDNNLPLADYLKLGFTTEHTSELLYMATDPDLLNADENDQSFWAAIHAWYALGQLRATESISSLLDLNDKYPYDKLFYDDLPQVISSMGISAIPELKNYLEDTKKSDLTRAAALPSLEKLGIIHRQECLNVLVDCLKQTNEQCKKFAGLVICSLIKFKATEYIDVIRSAFEQGYVEIAIPGDFEDVEIALNLKDKRSTPRPNYHNLPPEMAEKLQEIREIIGLDQSDYDHLLEPPMISTFSKIGRNDPCPCGSGKKYKKCCLH